MKLSWKEVKISFLKYIWALFLVGIEFFFGLALLYIINSFSSDMSWLELFKSFDFMIIVLTYSCIGICRSGSLNYNEIKTVESPFDGFASKIVKEGVSAFGLINLLIVVFLVVTMLKFKAGKEMNHLIFYIAFINSIVEATFFKVKEKEMEFENVQDLWVSEKLKDNVSNVLRALRDDGKITDEDLEEYLKDTMKRVKEN